MTTNSTDKYWKWAAIALVIYNLIAWFGKYGPEPEPVAPAKQEQARISTVSVDSIRSQIESQYRDSLQAHKTLMASRQAKGKIEYRYIRINDEQLERDYTEGKATADSVIGSKNIRIKSVETLLARCDSTRRLDSLTIRSQAGTISRKSLVGDSLSLGWEQANKDNAVLTDNLATEKQKDWGLGIQIGGTLFNGKPTPYIGAGLQYNVCRFRLKLPTSKK